jgi:predicted Zn-dependent protease
VFTGQGSVDPKLASTLLNMHFSREQESAADEGGLKRLRDGKVDLSGVQHFFERAEKAPLLPTILSDHPATESRAKLMAQYRTSSSMPIMSQADWAKLKQACR